ncbi:GNAT family N-acetyltransferase [Jiangella mangrovi]|uniref:Ribosomal protein S18 acetylase RimI-like enzyme n=1 Tax=Jiangella mangrovi TaxID=1524084 RepID=A0A7W9LMN7_9ACTN|nr:N-acetyltransferase [Jiangella mangrovi]MBB5789374.1 ribosomal protein S18 acetylase RimI-like enzyme [Jiangella mangrovi]
MTLVSYLYDLAADDDATAIAGVHTESWLSAYRGHVPDAFLDDDLAAEHLTGWTTRFGDRTGTLTVVARGASGALAGFAHTFVDHDPRLGSLVDNLHVRPELKGQGIGRRLLAETAVRLQDLGAADRLHLEVIETNEAARGFYVALGGVEAGRGTNRFGDQDVPILVYAWASLDPLAAPLRLGPST